MNELHKQGVHVSLDALMVGDPAAGEIYARSQKKRCEEVGIDYRLHTLSALSTESDIRAKIRELNEDPNVTGILLNLPMPDHIDAPAMQYYIVHVRMQTPALVAVGSSREERRVVRWSRVAVPETKLPTVDFRCKWPHSSAYVVGSITRQHM